MLLGALVFPPCAQAAQPWLFVNDVHFDPRSRDRAPNYTGDTDKALLDSLLDEMHRLAPDPPVIVMPGDFLSHHFRRSSAVPTMIDLAARFNRRFPRAQFVMALGNEDSPCGDYGVAANSSFLLAVAKAWAPLVDRNGAAPISCARSRTMDFIRPSCRLRVSGRSSSTTHFGRRSIMTAAAWAAGPALNRWRNSAGL